MSMSQAIEDRSVSAMPGSPLAAEHPVLRIAGQGVPAAKTTAEASARLMRKRALAAGPPRLCGDQMALRWPGPISMKDAAWSRDGAAVGDELDLTAEVNGTDVSGILFRITDARGQAVATLTAMVAGTQARTKWRVPPSGSSGEQYDFAVWKGSQCLGRSNRLFVADVIHAQLIDERTREPLPHRHYEITLGDGTLRHGMTDESGFLFEENVPPGRYFLCLVDPPAAEAGQPPSLQLVEGARSARRHVHVGRVRAIPSRALEGDVVRLRAFVLGASEGERIVFRVFRGAAEEPCAVLEGQVSGESATAEWKVSGVDGGGASENGMDFVDFDLEAEWAPGGERRHCFCELRGYARPQG